MNHLVCPNCGEQAAHYEPPTLSNPGGFICRPPRSWLFSLAFPRAPRGLNSNDRPPHWSVKHRSTQHVRGLVFREVVALDVPRLARCRVDVVWVVNTKHRRDTDNLAPFLKAIYDGIGSDRGISAAIVADDDPAHMEKPGATIRYDRDAEPHFEVTITALPALGENPRAA